MPLYQAQMGGGTENAQMYERMATSIQEAIKRGQTPQAVYESLIARKMDQKLALKLVSSVVKYMMESGELEEENLEQAQQQDQAKQEALEQDKMLMAQEKDAAAQQQMDIYRQQSMDAAMDTSAMEQEEEESNNDTEEIFGFKAGGENVQTSYESLYESPEGDYATEETVSSDGSKFSLDELIEQTPGTQNLNFPGIEQYYMPYTPLASNELEVPDFTPAAKYGGAQKKKFAKNVMALLKKQAGGPQEDEVVDTTKAKQTDDLIGSVKKKQSSFVEAVGNTAKKVKIDEWFNKLQETQDPLLDQILSPVPEGDPAQEQMQQAEMLTGQDQMKRGGQKRAKRKYDRLLNRANKLLGIEAQEEVDFPLDFGNLPLNQYNKYGNFVDQRFQTIDVPTLQKYFLDLAQGQISQDRIAQPIIDIYETGIFGRPKKYRVIYPQPSKGSAETQAEEAVLKNNFKNAEGFEEKDGSFNPAPANTVYDPENDVMRQEIQESWRSYNPVTTIQARSPQVTPEIVVRPKKQMGGFVHTSEDPSVPSLTKFIQGGLDFPEEAKNVNDPYFTDMGQYQDGGMTFPNPDEDPENPMHHLSLYSQASDIFHQPMNTVESARMGGPKRKDKRNRQRITNTTLRDTLIPANRFIDYAGSYAQQVGLPTYYNSNIAYTGSMDDANLLMTNVTKRGLLGNPKQWTDYYLVNTEAPVDLSQHTLFNQSAPTPEEEIDLGLRARMAINRGERQTERQRERAVRRGYLDEEQEMQEGGTPEESIPAFYDRLAESMYYQPQLRRGGYLPMAFEGLENTPVSYTSNPALEGQKEVDFTVASGANTNLPVKSYWDTMGANPELDFNQNPQFTAPQQPEAIMMPEGYKEYQQPKSTSADKPEALIKTPQLIGVTRTKQDVRTVDPEAGLNSFNAAANFGVGLANRKQQREQEAQMYEQNFNPIKLYGKKERMDRGDWEVNQGSYRFDQEGSNRLGRSKQYGGPMFQEGGENDVTFMSEEQIREFLAAGGEIEFL